MSIDIRDLSGGNVDRVTSLLSRRPEYGIARPSRRWLQRQEVKLKSLPNELLDTSNFLKRLIIKLADNIHPTAIDPRAVLCKVHSALNPWLIRRLFLAVAYEVTVHSDTIRSWKGKKDVPVLSAFVGRIDAIAALWTEPELYRQCYGTPPFESHMVFVKSGCEACILSAVGANARVLADLRAILIDRVERRSPRRDTRPASEPRLGRFIDSWIRYFQEERAAKCIARSDNVLAELRNARPQLMQWRDRRREEHRSYRASRVPIYTELKRTNHGHRLTAVPADASHSRRTRDGIPVALADPEDVEERRAAMYSLRDGESVYRPDSMNPLGEAGQPAMFRYDAMNLQDSNTPYDEDPYFDYEEMEGDEDPEHALGADEDVRSQVGDWYADRLATSRADLTADDARSMLSAVHPAFQPNQRFTHGSAVPPALGLGANRHRSASAQRFANRASVWTDVSVHTDSTSVPSPSSGGDAPPMPRVPSQYRRRESTRAPGRSNNDNGAARPPLAPRGSTYRGPSGARPSRPRQNSAPSIAASSVYSSDQPTPRPPPPVSSPRRGASPRGPPPAFWNRNWRFEDESSSRQGSSNSHRHSRNRRSEGGTRPHAADDNTFVQRGAASSAPRSEGGGGGGGRGRRRSRSVGVSSSTRSESAYNGDNDGETTDDAEAFFGPPTPRASSYAGLARDEWRRHRLGDDDDDDSDLADITPWPSFYRRPDADK
ncbi:hypothetical protein F4820DRAFT_146011 [Hypoxylon rubiginosum]|uniref:Uncharacterized protein n=1 Tax=Hypoxylon rubiginosum TaxID=110542 RepID=A0ACB9ZGV4_9PEZI|nr:hypothetical protein F4820DRAFT_146011 [Hypoxylon rubiginosum]